MTVARPLGPMGSASVGAAVVAAGWQRRDEVVFRGPGGDDGRWAEVLLAVRELALGIRSALPAGRLVGIVGADGTGLRTVLLAALCSGAVVRLDGPVLTGGSPGLRIGGELVDADHLRVVGREADRRRPDRFEDLVGDVGPDDDAVVLHGHRFSHGNLLWAASGVCQRLGVDGRDVVASDLPLDDPTGYVLGLVVPAVVAAGVWVGPVPTGGGAGGPTVSVLGRDGADQLRAARMRRRRARLGAHLAGRFGGLPPRRRGRGPAVVVVDAPERAALLATVGFPAWVATSAPGVAGPLALGEAGPVGCDGRPLAGAAVGVTEDGQVVVRSEAVPGAAGSWLRTGRWGRIDADGRLHLRPGPVGPR